MRINLLFHTLRYLKFRQIRYQFWYRVRKLLRQKIGFRYPVCIPKDGIPLQLKPFIIKPESWNTDGNFTFLNQTCSFTGWNDKGRDKLWMYNLNYMDFLHQPDMTIEAGRYWISSFIDGMETNKDGLEPYPIALRGINWMKFLSDYHPYIPMEEKQKWDASLYAQYKILQDNLEYHLLGNHLLEDAFSLFFAGLYFSDTAFYSKAEQLLRHELAEQILPDGAHFELSPMYHQILLDRLLDCINASKYNLRFVGQEALTAFMEKKACRMLGWLEQITYRDGTIPLLNDAAYGIAPETKELLQYAKRLGLDWEKTTLKESGYRKFTSDKLELIMDIGRMGPDYIPGHAHADTFNYELRIGGKPFIVDTGISTYNKNNRRQYERETAAHNTVTVGGRSSSQVWGGFKVARRAKICCLKEYGSIVEATHDGFRNQGVYTTRKYEFSHNTIRIQDIFTTNAEGKGYLILNSDIEVISIDSTQVRTNKACIIFKGIKKLCLEKCEMSNRYNRLQRSYKLCYTFVNNAAYEIRVN